MLVTFTTKAHADITMFGDVAIRLLGFMGHSGAVPSALAVEDMPQALRRLRQAVESEDSDRPDRDNGGDGDTDDETADVHVSLKHRALPLIQLLEAAARDQVPVTWDD